MSFCECNSGSYRWRDVARINGEYFKVDEPTVLLEDGTFDIDPIFEKLADKHGVDRDDIELETFMSEGFPEEIIEKFWDDKLLGGYCAVCGGDI